MKKLFAILALWGMVLAANAQNYSYDIDGDGDVSLNDIMFLVNKILGIPNPGEEAKTFLNCPDDNHPHMIDLGLPSGTKWACCNVGANKPEEYGGYYAWGETQEKEVYDEVTYQYADGVDTDGDGRYDQAGETDEIYERLGDNIAGSPYDVASVEWGDKWQMPRFDQIHELVSFCSYTWTDLNGVNGGLFTAPNGNTIFLPAAGSRVDEDLDGYGDMGTYYSSTQKPDDLSSIYTLDINQSGMYTAVDGWASGKFVGYSVRPVSAVNTTQYSGDLEMFFVKSYLAIGEILHVYIRSGSGSYMVGSTDPNVAMVSMSNQGFYLLGVSLGSTQVTVTDTKTGFSRILKFDVVAQDSPL